MDYPSQIERLPGMGNYTKFQLRIGWCFEQRNTLPQNYSGKVKMLKTFYNTPPSATLVFKEINKINEAQSHLIFKSFRAYAPKLLFSRKNGWAEARRVLTFKCFHKNELF